MAQAESLGVHSGRKKDNGSVVIFAKKATAFGKKATSEWEKAKCEWEKVKSEWEVAKKGVGRESEKDFVKVSQEAETLATFLGKRVFQVAQGER